MKKKTTLSEFKSKLGKICQKEAAGLSLLYVVFASHGNHNGAYFSDGAQNHIVTLMSSLLEKLVDIPVVLNASFCRSTKESFLRSPMAEIPTHHVSSKSLKI